MTDMAEDSRVGAGTIVRIPWPDAMWEARAREDGHKWVVSGNDWRDRPRDDDGVEDDKCVGSRARHAVDEDALP